MTSRNRFAPQERAARSRLAQLLHGHEIIQGSVVSMARRCGKAGCRCKHEGNEHVSLYLSVKIAGKRRMVYIPAHLEEEVRCCVQAHRETQALAQVVSQACLHRVLEKKRKHTNNG